MRTSSLEAKRVILDVDTGEDDALAILAACSLNVPLLALVTSYGNTSLENATRNSAAMLELSDCFDIPVIAGSSSASAPHPIESAPVSAGSFVGSNGLCNLVLPSPSKISIQSTENLELSTILHALKTEQNCSSVDYIVTGPLTNLAGILSSPDQALAKSIQRVFIMGGAFQAPGNTGPVNPHSGQSWAEFNFYCDPHAATEVLRHPVEKIIVPWDVTSHLTVSESMRRQLVASGQIGAFTLDLMDHFFECYGSESRRSFELNDVITILAWMGVGRRDEVRAHVVTSGIESGRSVLDPTGYPLKLFSISEAEYSALIEKTLSILEVSRG